MQELIDLKLGKRIIKKIIIGQCCLYIILYVQNGLNLSGLRAPGFDNEYVETIEGLA